MPKEYCVITFASTHQAIRSEKALRERGLAFLLIPIPREISAGCGLALRVSCEGVQKVLDALQAVGVSPEGVFRLQGKDSLIERFKHARRDNFSG